MARVFTTGFELAIPGSSAPSNGNIYQEDALLQRFDPGGTTTSENTIVRSGAHSMKIVNSAATDEKWGWVAPVTQSRTYFMRGCFQISAFGNSNTWPMNLFGQNSQKGLEIMVTPAGVLTAAFADTDAQVVLGPTVVTGQWYVVEASYTPNTGATQLWVDNVSYGTGTCETFQVGDTNLVFAWGAISNGTQTTWYFDDYALNDDQGAAQNARCGFSNKVVMLKPTSDSSATGFTAGAGGASSLFNAVDNTPPIGVSQVSATNAGQIKDNGNNTTDNYQANVGAYTTAIASGGGGIGGSDTIVLVQGVCNSATSGTAAMSQGLQVVSNPVVGETLSNTAAAAGGTFPANWTTFKTAVSYAPSVTLGTSPVIEFRRNTASTDFAMADFMGLCVEYTPAVGGATLSVNAAADSTSSSEFARAPFPSGVLAVN